MCRLRGGGRRPRGRGGRDGASRLARHDTQGSHPDAAQARRRARGARRGAGAARVAERRQAARGSRDEVPFVVDNLRFFAGAARVLEGKSAGEYMAGLHADHPARAARRRRRDLPVELPAHDGRLEDGPGAGRRQRPVLKPSEQTPLSLLRFVQLAQEIIPAGVLNVVTGDGVPVGERLVAHPDVAARLAHRRRSTGKEIARTAAETLKRVHLELGGKAPVIVFDDADPRRPPRPSSSPATGTPARTAPRPRASSPGPRSTTSCSRSSSAGRVAQGRRPAGERRDRDGLGHLEGAAGAGPRLPRAGEGRGGPHRRRRERRSAASSSADGRRRRGAADEIVQDEVFGPVVTVQRFTDDDEAIAGQTTSATGSPPRSGRATSAGRCAVRRSSSGRSGSTTTSCCLRDAARRLQAVRLRQGPVDVLDRGLHADQARRVQDRLTHLGQRILARSSYDGVRVDRRDLGGGVQQPEA